MNEFWWQYFVGWRTIVGFVFSIFVGHYFINKIMEDLWTTLGDSKRERIEGLRGSLLGCIERFLYTTSWLVGLPEFIGLWLFIKTIGKWKREKQDFNVFLIESGMSISYGIVGGIFITYPGYYSLIKIVVYPIFLVLLSIFFLRWLNHSNTRNNV